MEPKHRARHRASATKGTTALRHHQDGKGSSSQPTGYDVHVTPYLCAEKFIKSLTTDVGLGGGFSCAHRLPVDLSPTLDQHALAEDPLNDVASSIVLNVEKDPLNEVAFSTCPTC